MKSKTVKTIAATSLLMLVVAGLALAQRNRPATKSVASPSLAASLPPSDAVALVNVSRVLNEAMPKLLADNPTKLAEVNAELDKFKTQTGLDPRSFEQVALGFSYQYPRPGYTKVSTIALARGKFNAAAMVAAGRLAADGDYSEEKYQGKTIYVFSFNRQIKMLGLWYVKIGELAVTALDGNNLALGDRTAVRGAIDAVRTKKYANPNLLALASRDPDAIVGFGGNISPALLDNLNLGNATIARELTAVRQVYGTLGMTTTDLELMLTAKTVDNESAKNLSDSLEGLKMLGTFALGRMQGAKGVLARSAVDNLKVTIAGNELQVRTAVGQSQVSPLMRGN
ncbi:MAG TPA: hypothetical protein VLL54_18520 [Pyrinomonadaceae bacterium]|nr:hypothetical protein [Pyrinomonadaceae bacterium]